MRWAAVGALAAALACVLPSVPSARQADSLWYRSLTIDDGLSQQLVTALAQDRDGFMWFGSPGGLDRWDGYRFERFSISDPGAGNQTGATVLALSPDAAGALWVGSARGFGRLDPATGLYRHLGELGGRSGPLPVEAVVADRSGRLWVLSFAGGGLARFDPATGQRRDFVWDSGAAGHATAVLIDGDDRLWLSAELPVGGSPTGSIRLYWLDGASNVGDAAPAPWASLALDPSGGKVNAIVQDAEGLIWLAREGGGLVRIRAAADSTPEVVASVLPRWFVRSLARAPDGDLWALAAPSRPSDRGNQLYRLRPNITSASAVSLRSKIVRQGEDATPQRVFIDEAGVLWLTTSAGGLRYAAAESGGFSLHTAQGEGFPGLASAFVRAVTKGREGEVWVGTSRGLNRIDRSAAGSRYSVPAWPGLGDLIETEIRALLLDNAGQLWIGTPKGLAVIDPWSGRSRRFRHEPRNPRSLSEDSIHVIRQDTAGAIWVGTLGAGLNRFDAGTGSFTRYRVEDEVGLPGNTIEALYTDRHRRLWVGTNAGVVTLDESTSGARRFVRPTPASDALASAKILAFGESAAADGAMWIGTEQRGLIRLDGSGSAKFLTTANSGLPDNTIYGIATDRRGRLWLSTNRGVALYDPGTDVFQRFGLDRNLQSNEFNARASFVAEDGEIFFGGVGGLNTFYPDDVQVSPPPARVWVMAATARDRNQEGQAAARTIYRRGLPSAKARVAFGERDLAFEFVAPRYGDGQIKYFYRLDPHDAFWHGPVDARRAEYANLGPGDYTFRVRAVGDAASGDGPVDAVAFTVLPPFYSTWWFRAVGLAVLTLTIGGAYRLRTRALHQRRAELEQEVTERTEALHQANAALEQQARQLRTLDEAKSAFFANTSHDFRTPLTLTLGPLRDILAGLRGPVPEPVRADVSHALANAEQMLEMVEQLLLLARFDAGQPDFRPVVSRLDACLRRVAERFEWLAAHVGIRFVVCLPDHAVWAEFDEEKIDRAVGNLLTNAFKFTPAGGTVAMTLSVADQAATVVVEDSGSGIPAEQRRQVFDRFYRASSLVGERPGTGLGLPIAQLFVELNRGTIEVTDGAGGGAAFVVRLPTLPEGPSSASQESHVSPRPHTFGETAIAALSALSSDRSLPADESGEATAADDRPTVLVVEDHADVRAYLRRHLETAYRVVEAASAEEALAGMAAEPPDVIVSDVMMPGMDGHAFCRAVRSNPETDHLPIILLTARAGQDDTLAGLGAGADEYVTKPFDPAELLTRVRGILRARERLRARYGRVGGAVAVVPGPAEVQSVESMFVERIRQILEERSHDENFDISALGVALGVSRAQLHRKTREILGTTPAEVLIQFRLARAAQLLASRAGNVGEVAYAVGFRNLSHFVKRFRQQHGQTPAAFAAAHSADSAS